MSFKPKTEPYGIADGTTLVITSVNGGESATNVEAIGQDGSIVANEVCGEVANPSAQLAVKADVTKTAGAWKLGHVTTADTKSFALESIDINTSAGAAPTVSVSGKQVQASATDGCTYSVPALSLSPKHHAQILFSAFTLTGTGCHLTAANYKIAGTVNVVTKDAVPISFDIVQGKIEVSVTVKQCGTTEPTLSAGTGFSVTSPLALTNPDADYATYTATLTCYLAKDTPAAANS